MRHFRDTFDILCEYSEDILSMSTKIDITTHGFVGVRRISYTAYKQTSSSFFCSEKGNCANVLPFFWPRIRATRAPFPGLSCSLHGLAGSASGSLAIHLRYAAAPASTPIPADLTATPVSFQGSGGITLHGTIFDPAHTQGGRSGVVLVSGSGTGLRTETQPDAIAFAQQGLSTLIYDKRSVGYSPFQLSYLQLADDAHRPLI